ncbi:diguanylate cyclase [Gloeothece citriformis PCC 7424]|uniref:Diguanylate cyclase n=1 Tax=Gloeothece citriformis (strain PCC 7424) TaxID=65393 RepID=B7KGN5_GLOC7|nr:diguanylate cyclase [Gloeothece citriformis]ACK71962.1 diguanylate cyclase [Gloeothece citriformis PCC 7424]
MKRYALVVGITQYDELNSLKKPAEDAEAVAKVLEEWGNVQDVKRLPEHWSGDRYEVGKNKLTGKVLIEALRKFLLEQAVNSEALIYFSGHGVAILESLSQQREGYLAASDCRIIRDSKTIIGQQNGISLRGLNNLILQSQVSSLVVILDCCHAGTFLDKDLVKQTLTAFQSSERDYYLMAACRSNEQAWEGENYSIFTEALLQGLSQNNARSDGVISCDRMADFIDKELKHSGQEPIRLGLGRSITLVKYQTNIKIPIVVSEDCPYQGLRYFTKDKANFFFGRDKVVYQLRQKLETSSFIPLIGVSGSGKSSVVRAGLIPLLEKEMLINGASRWNILESIKPGFSPLSSLAIVFQAFFPRTRQGNTNIKQLIYHDFNGLESLKNFCCEEEKYLLLIDQFEEIFTLCSDEEERQRFIDLITQVVEIPNCPLVIITTMRADFIEPCLSYPNLHQLIQTSAIYMPPLTGKDLRAVIIEPAKLQGHNLEDELILEIVQDLGREPGLLPLLEFALTKLWDERDIEKHSLTLEQYQKIKGVKGALNHHAEKVYCYKDFEKENPTQKRDNQQKNWIKRIFLRLIRTGTGNKDTRQRVLKAELLMLDGEDREKQEALRELLEDEGGLVCGRLIVSGQDRENSEPWIDLAHEALIEGWDTLVKWREESRDLRRLIDEVRDAHQKWISKGKNDKYLMMGGLLDEVKAIWEAHKLAKEFPFLQKFYEQSLEREEIEFEQLYFFFNFDSLTGLFNRRRYDEKLQKAWDKCKQEQKPLSLILADIDYFKIYNDTYGHLVGDECLKKIAQMLKKSINIFDDLPIVARYGGEEFSIILPEYGQEKSIQVAKKIMNELQLLKITYSSSPLSDYMTLSLGIACTIPNKNSSPDRLLSVADQALYRAKVEGRNRFIVEEF